MSVYLSRIEGSPPKRNAVGSIPITDAKRSMNLFVDRFFTNEKAVDLSMKSNHLKRQIVLYIILCFEIALYLISLSIIESIQVIEIVLYAIILILYMITMILANSNSNTAICKACRYSYDFLIIYGIGSCLNHIIELYAQ